MELWLIIPLSIWIFGLIVFLVSVIREAPRHGVRPLQFSHILVGVFWPFWALWYLFVILSEWWKTKN